jgi:hypothetical protein
MVHIIRRVRIHWPYFTRPLEILQSSLFDVPYSSRYIIHAIERHVAVIRLPSQYCEKGSGFEFLPHVSYLGPLYVVPRVLQVEALITIANTRITGASLHVMYS